MRPSARDTAGSGPPHRHRRRSGVRASTGGRRPSPAIAAAVANPARPADDVARDADRKPAETLAFFEVKPGEVVFEFVAGGGYFTELLSRTVGESGRVVATREAPERIADGRLPNVTAVPIGWGLAPDSVDLIFTALNYHDVVNLKVDRPPLLKNFMTILKPGGIFAVIDHSAEAGSGDRDVGTLHRIDEALVVSEIKAAGFELVGTSDLLRNPNDARTLQGIRPGDSRQDRPVRAEVPQAAGRLTRLRGEEDAQVRRCHRRV